MTLLLTDHQEMQTKYLKQQNTRKNHNHIRFLEYSEVQWIRFNILSFSFDSYKILFEHTIFMINS